MKNRQIEWQTAEDEDLSRPSQPAGNSSDSEPVFPAQYPSYDWSDDDRWLVVAADRFFRLLAPEYVYEQLLPHEFDSCLFAWWSD